MSGGDRYEPLWADSLADQPRPDVIARVVEDEDDAPPPPPRPEDGPPGHLRALAFAALPLLAVMAVLLARESGGSLTVEDVPSFWNDIPMTCHTVRLEQDARAVEWFQCRALGGGSLPPGLYESVDSRWRSDLTRERARSSRIRIAPDGKLVGRASY